jgi:cystathionine beta-synthase
MGIEVSRGDPKENIPGKKIIIPEKLEQVEVEDFDMEKIRHSYLEKAMNVTKGYSPTEEDIQFLAEDSKSTVETVREGLKSLGMETKN